jgi:hypothetical protein
VEKLPSFSKGALTGARETIPFAPEARDRAAGGKAFRYTTGSHRQEPKKEPKKEPKMPAAAKSFTSGWSRAALARGCP